MNRNMIITVSNTLIDGIENGMLLQLGNIAEKKSGAIGMHDNLIDLNFLGTYIVYANFMLRPKDETLITIKAYKNGIEIPCAIGGVESDCLVSIPLQFIVEKENRNEKAEISFAVFAQSTLEQIHSSVSVVMV